MNGNILQNDKNIAVNAQYRMHYHMIPPVGWMNDPNGLIYYGGKYHLFFQSNPHETAMGTMCWGHFISDDLISYSYAGIALAADNDGESIYSGGAIECDGQMVLLYTLHYEKDGVKWEEVHAARSSDGINFIKCGRVFDNVGLPKNISRTDFRDPCPAKVGDEYFVFVGGKDTKKNAGVIAVLAGRDPFHLSYRFTIGPYYELGDTGECPSYCRIDGKDVIVVSGCSVPARANDFKNLNSSVIIVGEIDFESGCMLIDSIKEIDKGDAFYAPQFVRGADRPVIVGWLETWGKRYLTHELRHGWSGSFTIPRELSIKNGEVFQSPVASLNKYCFPADKPSQCMSIDIELGIGDGVIISADNGSVMLGNDCRVFLDTTLSNNLNGCVRHTNSKYERCVVRALVDVSGIELFVDGGRESISSRIFLDGKYSIVCRGNARILGINEIRVKR